MPVLCINEKPLNKLQPWYNHVGIIAGRSKESFLLAKSDWVTKERVIWDPRALQLLRESTTVKYARKVVPWVVGGVHIRFPETEVFFGSRVGVKSERIEGQSLLSLAYEQGMQGLALDMAMIALQALERSTVVSNPFRLFGVAYGIVRRLKVITSEWHDESILSPEQRDVLNRLVASYTRNRGGTRKVLVHGDLHAGNLLVNYEEKSLGFVDLEMLHVGKSATNFAQLWISFHFADVSLGRLFYQRYVSQFADVWDERFDADVKAEIALRSYALVREAKRIGNIELERKAYLLMGNVLDSSQRFRDCLWPSSSLGDGKCS